MDLITRIEGILLLLSVILNGIAINFINTILKTHEQRINELEKKFIKKS